MAKMNCYKIDVNGKSFEYQEVHHEKSGCYVLIGTISLEEELINEDGSYNSEYAKHIDEKFYGYVEDELFDTLTYDSFVTYVNDILDWPMETKFIKTGEEFSEIAAKLKEECVEYLTEVTKANGRIKFDLEQ